jgi:hypothetical protein
VVLVLGTGEFAYPPYLLAQRLESLGCEVLFQATTRSPLLCGEDLSSSLEFLDNYHDGIPNYLYNATRQEQSRALIGYEARPIPPGHTLPEMLGAVPLFF